MLHTRCHNNLTKVNEANDSRIINWMGKLPGACFRVATPWLRVSAPFGGLEQATCKNVFWVSSSKGRGFESGRDKNGRKCCNSNFQSLALGSIFQWIICWVKREVFLWKSWPLAMLQIFFNDMSEWRKIPNGTTMSATRPLRSTHTLGPF